MLIAMLNLAMSAAKTNATKPHDLIAIPTKYAIRLQKQTKLFVIYKEVVDELSGNKPVVSKIGAHMRSGRVGFGG